MNSPSPNKWLIVLAVMIPTLIEILDMSVANVALPHIQGSLSAGQEEVTWVLTSYLVSNAVVIPMSGWFARLMGRKRYLIASLVVFTVSSVLCGAATSLTQIIVFRIIQGLGGGGLQPMSQAILMETFPPEERGKALGIFGMGAVCGPVLGPLLGGYLTDYYSWRWIFYINLPVGIVALAMLWAYIFDPPYQERRARGESIDYVGISLLCVGLGSLQIVLDKGQLEDWFNSEYILILSIVAATCLIVLVFWELRQERPILDLRIFKDRSFATGNIIMFLGFFAIFGSVVLLPLFLQTLMGYTAFLAGWVLGPGAFLAVVLMPVSGTLAQRVDARIPLAIGILMCAWSCYYMAGFSLHVDLDTTMISRLIQGVGIAFFFVPCAYVTMAYVGNEQMNNASGIFNLLRNLGGSFGVAFVTTLLARRTQFHQHHLIDDLDPYNPGYVMYFEQLKTELAYRLGSLADHSDLAREIIYRYLYREAAAIAYMDVFYALGVMMLALIGLLWIIRKPPRGGKGMPIEAH